MGFFTTKPTVSPTPKQRIVGMTLLFLINLVNHMDRTTVSGVLSIKDPIKAGFIGDLTFTEGGLLQTCFVVTFMLLAPAFGYLGDRYTRKHIICAGVSFWSIATLLCSFTNEYWQLLICRALVGVGEASYATIAPTIIADLYAGNKRTAALAFFYIGIPLGSALGYLMAIVGARHGFRWAFRVTPGIGVVLAILGHLFLVEPIRGSAEGATESELQEHGIKAFLKDIKTAFRIPSFASSTIGFTAVTFATGALSLWLPKFVVEMTEGTPYETSPQQVGITLGSMTAINGIVGTLTGAYIARTLGKRTERAEPIVCLCGLLLTLPTCGPALFMFHIHKFVGWILLFIAEFGLCLNWALVAVIMLNVITPQHRSSAHAIQLLVMHIFGDGAISDALVQRGLSHGMAMAFSLELCMIMALIGAVCFAINAYFFPRDKAAMLANIAEHNDKTLVDNTGNTTCLPLLEISDKDIAQAQSDDRLEISDESLSPQSPLSLRANETEIDNTK